MVSTQIDVHLQCSNLPSHDKLGLGKPNAVAKVYLITKGKEVRLGHTEEIQSTKPSWQKSFKFDYYFELPQAIRVQVMDVESEKKGHVVGDATIPVGQLISAVRRSSTKALMNPDTGDHVLRAKKPALVTLTCEKVDDTSGNDLVTLELAAAELPKMDGFLGMGSSDPYVQICRDDFDIFSTEYVEKDLNPSWKPFTIGSKALCNNDYNRELTFKVFDHNQNKKPDFIGECKITLNELISKQGGSPLKLELKRVGKSKKFGFLVVNGVGVVKQPTFLEYLNGGAEVSLMVALDFTESNCPEPDKGPPRDPKTWEGSVHRFKEGVDNDYVKAIKIVGDVLTPYITKKDHMLWGFGAQIDSSGKADHCFNLSFDKFKPKVKGLDGILKTYEGSFEYISKLSGPTYFAEVLRKANDIARMTQELEEKRKDAKRQYNVLLIITDGSPHDMAETRKLLVESSELPLSVIMVGVGRISRTEDFRNLVYLDSDQNTRPGYVIKKNPLARLEDADGNRAKRDIVQFVKLHDDKYKGHPEVLARDALAELPDQFLSYMKLKGKMPLDAEQRLNAEKKKHESFLNDHPPEFELSVDQEVQKREWEHMFNIEPEVPLVPSAPPPNFDDDE